MYGPAAESCPRAQRSRRPGDFTTSGPASLVLLVGAIVSASDARLSPAFRQRTVILILIAVMGSAVLLAVGPAVGGIRQRLVILAGCLWQLLLLDALRRDRTMATP